MQIDKIREFHKIQQEYLQMKHVTVEYMYRLEELREKANKCLSSSIDNVDIGDGSR